MIAGASPKEWETLLPRIDESTVDAILAVDLAGRVVYCNAEAERLMQGPIPDTSLEEWVKRYGLFHSDGVTPFRTEDLPLARALRGESVDRVTILVRPHDAATGTWVSSTALPMRQGPAVVGAVIIFRDITAQKQSEKELQEAQERLQNLMAATPAVLFICEAGEPYRITFVSDNAPAVFGYEPEESREPNFWKARAHPEDVGRLPEALAACFQFGRHGWDYRLLHKDGSYRWVHEDMRLVDRAGVREIAGCVLDITERKQAEEALRRSERNYRELAELLPQTVFECDVQGRLTFVNRRGQEIFGVTPDQLRQGLSLLAVIAPEHHRRAMDNLARRLYGQPSAGAEYSVVRADGTLFPAFAYTSIIYEGDQAVGLRGLLVDITEHKRAQEALQDWTAVMASTSDAILMTRDHIVTAWNPGAEEIFGYTAQEAIGRDIEFIVPVEFRERLVGTIRQLERGERVVQLETQRQRKDGRRIDVSVTITPLLDSSGEFHVAASVARDITARKQGERELLKRNGLLDLLRSTAAAANQASDIESAIEACLERICAHTGWPIGHAYLASPQDPSALVSTGIWHLDDPARFGEFRAVSEGKVIKTGIGLPGQVLATGKPQWCKMPPHEASPPRKALIERLGIEAAFASPILVGSEVVGVLEFFSLSPGLDEPLAEVASSIGVQLGRVVERTLALRAVAESEARYRAITETAAHAVLTCDQAGLIQFANATAERIFGYSRTELYGRGLLFLFAQRHQERVTALFRPAGGHGGEGAPSPVEVMGTTRSGAEILLEISAARYFDKDGCPVSTAVVRDLTKRRLAEEQVRKLSRAVEHSPALIVITDRTGAIEYVNPAFTRVAGYTLDEVRGKNPRILKSDRTPPEVYRSLWGTLEAGGEWRGELYNRKKNGELYWEAASISPIPDADGRITHYIAVKEDISERKRAEAELSRANKTLRAVIDAAPLGIVTLDLESRVQNWNSGAERIFGWSEEEVLGRKLPVIPPEGAAGLADRVQRSLRGELRRFEGGRQRKDGSSVYIEGWCAALRGDDGVPTGVVIEYADLTGRKQLEEQLRQAQKLESIGQLAAGIAHEINTPIQYVADNTTFLQEAFGSLSLLLEFFGQLLEAARSGAVTPDLVRAVEAAIEAADLPFLEKEIPDSIRQCLEGVGRVARIVHAMKEFSHPGPQQRTAVDLNRSIESTILVCRNEWKYVARLETDLDPGLPLVPCVPGDINQALLNLIVNAAHAIAEVVGTSGQKGVITVATRHEGDWAAISVRDTGCGIAETIRGRVFDPFFTTKEVGKGTGQGLAIAHSVVVQKHAGSISFESQLGVGTTFTIRLPLQ
jgi:PAS domain S-box-containing protein